MRCIVQFIHPGPEHGFDKKLYNNGFNIKDWNNITIKHKRKFLINESSYIENGKMKDGKLLFWGEWEPPSRVEELITQTHGLQYGINPIYLHFPFLPPANEIKNYQETLIYHEKNCQDTHYYQNTDPFVFGNNFIYGICQQKITRPSLRDLKPGSLIIFGSRVNDRFAIDTVFVVKTANRYYSLNDVKKMNLGIYPDIVTKFITDKNCKVYPPHGHMLYTGATYDDQEQNMYSFVPAKVYNGNKIGFPMFFMPDEFYCTNFRDYFEKSHKDKNDRIIEKCRGVKGSNKIRTFSEVYEFWKYIKTEVSKDHVLGVNFKMPEVDDDFHWKEENWNPPVSPKKGSCVGRGC